MLKSTSERIGDGNMGSKYVWYACYGSNLLKERFMLYIQGGRSRFNGVLYKGCLDKSEPSKDEPITIPYDLYFGNRSGSWENGGVAFLKPEKDEKAVTLGRMYRITEEQFLEVQEQEGSWYRKELNLGIIDGIEVKTFTHSEVFFKNLPGKNYIEVIKAGLKETYPNMSELEIENYLEVCLDRK